MVLQFFFECLVSPKDQKKIMKRICVSVSNDLMCDNRVDKTCQSLAGCGLEVRLLGRRFSSSPLLEKRAYDCRRLRVWCRKNFPYYAELNLRLFFYLLFTRQNLLWANDLDTLLPNFLVAKLKRIPLIFDSHEHFTQVPELKDNPFAQKVWKAVEKLCVKRCEGVVTVCNPIKDYFKSQYNVESVIVRNIPCQSAASKQLVPAAKKDNILVWQGAVNVERGLEELCEAMLYTDAKLIIMGQGDIKDKLENMVKEWGIEDKVSFKGRLPFEQMMSITRSAKIAISIDKPTNGNYAISLPNKIFEYISACIPALVSPLCEIEPIERKYQTGVFIRSYEPKELAKQITELLSDNQSLDTMAANCRKAADCLCWENEQKKIFELIEALQKK